MRRVLLGFVAMVAVCAGVAQAVWPDGAPRVVSAQSALAFRVFVPGLAADRAPTFISVSSLQAFQGGAVRVLATRGESGTATIFGRAYPLQADAHGNLLGFVGIGVLDEPGDTVLTVRIEHASEPDEVFSYGFVVVKTNWTVDYITFTPDPDAPPDENPLDPANIAAENQLLADTYGGVSSVKWDGTWIVPVTAPVTGYFGEQRSFNGGPVSGHHGGTDFGATAGTPVYAANAGEVVISRGLIVRGNMVVIDHGAGVFSGYGHMSGLAVSEGQSVAKGQLIGWVGSTGLSTGAHLHWEMAVRGVLVDGLRWVDGSQGY
ncbi:MAG: M23 family metallopeptidase [Tepidiformaceae bacterium]